MVGGGGQVSAGPESWSWVCREARVKGGYRQNDQNNFWKQAEMHLALESVDCVVQSVPWIVKMWYIFFFWITQHGLWDLSSWTRDGNPPTQQWEQEVLTIGPARSFQDLTHFFKNHETCELGGIVEIIHFDSFLLRASKVGPGDVMICQRHRESSKRNLTSRCI